MSGLKLAGSISGLITLQPPAVAGTNTIDLPAQSGTLVIATPGSAGQVLTSDGSKWTSADPTPLPSPGTSGQVLTSNGSAWVSEDLPSQLPSPSTAGNILKANGSNWVSAPGQSILPTPGPAGSVLVSDGTQWVRGPTIASLTKSDGDAPYFAARAHGHVEYNNNTGLWVLKGKAGNIATVVGPELLDLYSTPTATFTFTFTTPMIDSDYLVMYHAHGRRGKELYQNDGDIIKTTTGFQIVFTTNITPKDLDNKHPNKLSIVIYR